ncbi:MAG: EAL and HDOD domain-containing protein [Thermocrinis sp.]|jgi:EAL and modified HD-GYP domain-containing signal transduction protein|uniref:EAL and HDOD domain-containing protein n=1 Tax=Thermocrinis sp. TaxID=2024383 RepID=UPI003BFD8314
MHVLKKQAIYDKNGNVAFWEVFVQDDTTRKHSEDIDPLRDATKAVDLLVELGAYRVGEGKIVFVNVPAIFLEASMFDLLSPEYVGIELVENKNITTQTYNAIKLLLKRGFKFCIDDFGFERIDYLPLLSKTHFIKIDIKNSPYNWEELKEVITIVKSLKKSVIAKNIETEEDYKRAKEYGFDYFQGSYLSPPTLVEDTRTISYLKSTILELYKALTEGDMKRIVNVLEKDVGAAYKLLKFANSAFFPRAKKLSSLEEAVVYLGFDNIVKLAIVLALSEMFAKGDEKRHWERALYRACLAEKLAEIYSPNLKAKAHTAGLFSLSQEIFGQRPENLALELGLDKDIVEAFEKKNTELGFILSLVELLEDSQDPKILEKIANILKTSPDVVKSIIESAKKESMAITQELA